MTDEDLPPELRDHNPPQVPQQEIPIAPPLDEIPPPATPEPKENASEPFLRRS